MQVIADSIAKGKLLALIGGVLVAGVAIHALVTNSWYFPTWMSIGLMILHPAWTVSAVHGDCGWQKVVCSYVTTAVLVVLLVIQAFLVRSNAAPAPDPPARRIRETDENPYQSPQEAGGGPPEAPEDRASEPSVWSTWWAQLLVVLAIVAVLLMLLLPAVRQNR